MQFSNAPIHVHPIHVGHHQVAENDVESGGILFESFDESIDANRIDHLVWALHPVVTELHRIVDSDQ